MNIGLVTHISKMKISIIIPTLRQGDYYDNVIKQITDMKLMDYEIISIFDKLVNEAWNEGVEKAKGDYILVINDDIILDKQTIDKMMLALEYYKLSCPYFTRKDNFEDVLGYNGKNIVGFCFMFKKENKDLFFPIPEQLKIWYGDNRIYQKAGRKFGWSGQIHHFESRTVLSDEHRSRINELIEQDKIEWALLCKQNGWLN